ncbi:hypothetical protein [Pelagibius sp.]|uniref:hypothetical protein n=1 Tax=Pelagibius sp. TaxID=1931238 RepID=UPI003BB10171
MKYTPAQFRDAVGVTQETFRHWREVLPVFQNRPGYAPEFSIGDLVTGAVIRQLRTQLGVKVSSLAELSLALGEACGKEPWAIMLERVLILDVSMGVCVLQSDRTVKEGDGLFIVMPLKPILAELSAALTRNGVDPQQPLYLLPTEVSSSGKRKAGKS